MLMNPHRRAKQWYEIVIGEKGLAVLKTGCLVSHQGVGHIACFCIIDYVLLKIVICGGCAFLAAIAYGDGRKYLVWFWGGLAVLYNPIIRFPLGRELWIFVNILTIIVLIVAMKTLKK